MGVPTMGWRTYKASGGSRLMRGAGDESRTIQVREGVSGWKEDLTFVRLFRYIGDPPKSLYTIICLDKSDSIVAMATGEFDSATWAAIFASLRKKRYPVDEDPS